MNIGQKFTLWITVVMTVIAAFTICLYYKIEMSEDEERLQAFGMTAGPIIEKDLNKYMMTRDQAVLDKTLHDLSSLKTIDNLWIIDKEGVIRVATDKKFIGMVLSPEDQRNKRFQEKGKSVLTSTERQIFRWVQPVVNKPECHACHQSSLRFNGAIIIDFDLSEIASHLKNDIYRGILVFIPALVVIGLVMIFLTNILVVRRLNKAMERMRRFREGDYFVTIRPEGNDEITRLEESFNEMAGMIQVRDREKDELIAKVYRTSKEWQETFDNITDPICISDGEFNITRFNKAFALQVDLGQDEIIMRKCYDIAHGTDGPVENCPHRMTLKTHQPASGNLFDPMTHKTFNISTFPYFLSDNHFAGSVCIARDITEEMEREKRFLITERMASLGRMASGIAHEINNPLATIAGCAEGLSIRVNQKRFDIDFFNNYLQIIMEEIKRCKNITSGMLSFVRDATDEKHCMNIGDTLENTLEVIGFQGRLRNVRIIKNYQDKLPDILGCDGELRQVFFAIITNALDSMGDSGTLTVETGRREDFVFVRISDTGAGMTQERAGRIFDPFYTTKADKQSTGLGLSIANKIILNHKGSIEVSSIEGEGSTFTINLPFKEN